MITRGEYREPKGSYEVIVDYKKKEVEVILVQNGQVCSAYKQGNGEEYSFLSNKAKEFWKVMQNGIKSCTAKNGVAVPFVYGTSLRHEFTKTKIDYCIETYNGEICLSEIKGENLYILLQHHDGANIIPQNIPYIKLTKASSDFNVSENDEDNSIPIRTVQEIALEKEDITWLRGKKYYIVNDDETAEKLFSYFDNYNGVISYDTETTGLRINCFGKINSEYARELAKWNEEHPDEQIRADKLVGIIFCIEKDVSYYFPVANRKYKNLYEDKNSEIRKKTIQNIKARYTVGDLKDRDGDMKDYVLKTPEEEFSCDVVLMERVRNILETKHIVAHNGAFEWKVDWLYEIDTNLKDDTMILHQIMYKFRSTTSNRGESSSLKYLAKRELGIEQWELTDFFPTMKEDKKGEVRSKGKKKAERIIDFSYMDYEGTRIYAPADGDITYQLFMKYKRDLIENHKEQEYLYNVEVMVACAVGYMEFYGHRLDEEKITEVRDTTKAEVVLIESEIRQMIGYSNAEEIREYTLLKGLVDKKDNSLLGEIVLGTERLRTAITNNIDHIINLASPAQVCKLFYDDLQIPFSGDKPSVAKKVVKSLLKAKDDEGKPKYPIVHLYSEYKKLDTLLTKFFDNLPYYMYPGGYIFSHFGQISTATGRMSANSPNCQQYPKSVTAIVAPRKDYIMMDADYSQIEYRVLVALSGEEMLAEMFADPDSDYHTLMASLMYGVPYASVTPKMRGDAKSFNFGIPYGMGFKSLAILLTGMSGPIQVEEAKEKYELYFKDQPKTRKFFNQVKEMASVNKYTKTFWNRYRYYSFEDKDGNISEFKKAAALRQAGNAVIQGSAADIFKISVARNFMYIRKNKLLGLFLIINMIHDEQLFEINYKKLNVQRVLRDVGVNMQFKVDGFPPLYIGAGIGPTWSKAKGKMTEIHPNLLDELSHEADNMPIFKTEETNETDKDILKYFSDRVYDFRLRKVRDYLLDESNHGKDIHPAIGNLLNLQFSYGHDKDAENLSDDQFTTLCLTSFIEENNLDLDPSLFKAQVVVEEEEEEDEYTDGEEEDMELMEEEYTSNSFAIIEETDTVYGASIQDLIKIFGTVVSKAKRVCGVDITKLNYKQRDSLIGLLEQHVCDSNDTGSMEVVFLKDAGVLNRTGIWVKGIDGSALETRLKLIDAEDKFSGTVNERLAD